MAEPAAGPLRLIAQDADDVPPLSALLQDAVVRVGDVAWDARARRLVLMASRYRWEAGDRTRVRAALRIDAVTRVQRRDWPADPETMLDLLALVANGDRLELAFAGGATLRIETECLDLLVEDVSEPWPARRTPRH